MANTSTTVSVFAGEVSRTWRYQDPKSERTHEITLFHDTLTGVRSLAVDWDEVPHSLGSSPAVFSNKTTHLQFMIGDQRGVVIIEKVGLLHFTYMCLVNGEPLIATMQGLAGDDEERFNVRVESSTLAHGKSDAPVAWYELHVERRSDGAKTIVHRRYREFQALSDQMESSFKGHHLRSSLPALPGRQLKMMVDHTDLAFVEERRNQLHHWLQRLLGVPHVSSMVAVHIFLGFFEKLKEHSVVFTGNELGLSVVKAGPKDESFVVSFIGEGEIRKTRVMVGDMISKINGQLVSALGLEGVNLELQKGHRPTVVHFLQSTDKNPKHEPLGPGNVPLVCGGVRVVDGEDDGGAEQMEEAEVLGGSTTPAVTLPQPPSQPRPQPPPQQPTARLPPTIRYQPSTTPTSEWVAEEGGRVRGPVSRRDVSPRQSVAYDERV